MSTEFTVPSSLEISESNSTTAAIKLTTSQSAAAELELFPDLIRGIRSNAKMQAANPTLGSRGDIEYQTLGMLDAYRARRGGSATIQQFKTQREDGDDLLGQVNTVIKGLADRTKEVNAFAKDWSASDIETVRVGTQAYVTGLPKWLRQDIYHNFPETGLHSESFTDRAKRNIGELGGTASTAVLTDIGAAVVGGAAIYANHKWGPIPDETPGLIGTGIFAVGSAVSYWRDLFKNGQEAVNYVEQKGTGPSYFAKRGMNFARRHTSNRRIIRSAGITASFVPHLIEEGIHAPVVIGGIVSGGGAAGGLLTYSAENVGADLVIKPITAVTRRVREGKMPDVRSYVKTVFNNRLRHPSDEASQDPQVKV